MIAAVSYRAVLRTPAMVPMIAAMALSRLGARMFALALVLLVLGRFASPELAGWLTFAAYGAGLLVSPVAGAFLDRVGPTVAIRIDLAASVLPQKFAGEFLG